MINKVEEELLNELYEIRFLDSEIEDDDDEAQEEVFEKIERYEEIVYQLSSSKNVSIIPRLCGIAEDKAVELSAVEWLVKTILKIVRNNNTKEGLIQVINGTPCMIPKAYYKARKLHIWIIRDDELRKTYIEVLKSSSIEEMALVKELLKDWIRSFEDEQWVSEILELI